MRYSIVFVTALLGSAAATATDELQGRDLNEVSERGLENVDSQLQKRRYRIPKISTGAAAPKIVLKRSELEDRDLEDLEERDLENADSHLHRSQRYRKSRGKKPKRAKTGSRSRKMSPSLRRQRKLAKARSKGSRSKPRPQKAEERDLEDIEERDAEDSGFHLEERWKSMKPPSFAVQNRLKAQGMTNMKPPSFAVQNRLKAQGMTKQRRPRDVEERDLEDIEERDLDDIEERDLADIEERDLDDIEERDAEDSGFHLEERWKSMKPPSFAVQNRLKAQGMTNMKPPSFAVQNRLKAQGMSRRPREVEDGI